MNNWNNCVLGDVAKYSNIKINTNGLTINNYVSTENMLPNRGGKTEASSIPNGNAVKYYVGQTLISNIRPYFKKIWQANTDGGCSADVLVFETIDEIHDKYFYYYLSQDHFFDYVMAGAKGTKMPRGDKQQILKYPFKYPSLKEQKIIANTLSYLDDKIELNTRISKKLEEMAQAIFKNWFVDFESYKNDKFEDSELGMIPRGWSVKGLDEIANYLNGLAMQKYRPISDAFIPVIKIKELNQEFVDLNSDKAKVEIPSQYVVNNGDIIFSWSGTLLVKIWSGGKGALNQHLFKVTSDKYDKWFYYLWTLYHLDKFKAIANDKATTMGHIKRSHLSESKVIVPGNNVLEKMNQIMNPIFTQIVNIKIQSTKLRDLRDTLLPKLMSGEIRVL